MKAVTYTRYGSPNELRVTDVPMPAPGDEEILIRLRAVSVNRSDWEGLTGSPLYARVGGVVKPGSPILGSDIAGTVEAAGKAHTQFKPGDEVFGELPSYRGGFAEYVCSRGRLLALKPAGLTFEQASAIPQAGVIAHQGLRDKVKPGQSVLINGAGGGAGSFAIQLAKLYGAEVTGVDNGGKLDFMRALGAHHVIDYTREDFTRTGRTYDLILDLLAYRSAFAYARALKPGGSYSAVGGSVATFLQLLLLAPLIKRTARKHMGLLMVRRSREDLEEIARMCESGKIAVPIDRLYALHEVPQALRYLGEGGCKGKLVIRMP